MFRPLTALSAVLLAVSTLAPAPARAVQWSGWNDGLQRAASARRPVIVDVYTDWCGWCKRMDRDVYARPEVDAYLAAHFVPVKLDAEGGELVNWNGRGMSARSLAAAFRVSGYPTTIFLNSRGEHLANVPGYIPADRFLLMLRFIGDGHADRGESWDDFVRHSGAGR